MWDVGGQESLRAYWRNAFEATDGIVWVVDAADTRRLDDCAAALKVILAAEKLAGASLLVVANKTDLPGALSADEIADRLKLKDIITNRHWSIKPSSAVTGDGLVDAVDWMVSDVASRIFMMA